MTPGVFFRPQRFELPISDDTQVVLWTLEEDVDDTDNGILCNLFKGYEIDISSEKCDIGTYRWPS